MAHGRSHSRHKITIAVCAAFVMTLIFVYFYPAASIRLFQLGLGPEARSVRVQICRFLFLFPFLLIPALWLEIGFSPVNDWLHRHRWQIGAGIIVAAVLLDISGSSLGMWNFWMGGDLSQDVVFGTPRASRTDEYSVMTPRAFAQDYSNYSYFNHIQGATASDMFLIKDAPVWAVAEIFRPFHWGYLLFGSSRGLAFYWSARLVLLFLTSYELFLLLTSDRHMRPERRDLAVLGSCLVTFAPMVQWWFAINSLPEMLITMSLAIIACDRFCRDHLPLHRFGYSLFIAWCAGMFLITLYPAWQIPLIWVLIALFIAVVASSWGTIKPSRRDIFSMVFSVVLLLLLLGTVLIHSEPTIRAMLSTSYPGIRKNTGGDFALTGLFGGWAQLLFPFTDMKPFNSWSPTELSGFIDLFPVGVILCIWHWFSSRHVDLLSAALIVVDAFLFIYICFGIPGWLSTVTLMTQTSGGRARVAFGLVNILLLVIGSDQMTHSRESLSSERQGGKTTAVIAFCAVGLTTVFWLAAQRMYQAAHIWYVGLLVIILGLPILLAFITPSSSSSSSGSSAPTSARPLPVKSATGTVAVRLHTVTTTLAVIILVCTGLSVNPVQLGSKPLTRQPQTTAVKNIEQASGHGTWLAAGDDSWLTSNLLTANGITTLNSLAVTPDIATWKKIDPTSSNKKIYNRYASITAWVNPDAHQKKTFRLLYPDHFSVKLTPDDLHTLGVRYVMDSSGRHPSSGKKYKLRQIAKRVGNDRFYEVVRK